MSDTVAVSGKCLCGAVEISAPNASQHMGACHCAMCRKWAGGPFMEVECGTELHVSGEEHVTRYQSSDWAERAFCSQCGTHLFYHFKPAGLHMVSIGLFQETHEPEFTSQIFTDKKPANYSFANKTEMLTEADIMARAAAMQKQDQ